MSDMHHDLVVGIDRWCAKRSGFNLSALAARSDVSYATVRRIYQNSITSHSLDSILSILAVIFDRSEQREFLRKHVPSLSNLIEGAPFEEMPGLNSFLTSKDHAIIIALASTKSGSSNSEIMAILGQEGLNAKDDLIEAGVVLEESGSLRTKTAHFSVLSPSLIKKQISVWQNIHDHRKVVSHSNHSYQCLITEKVNEQTLKKLVELERDFFKQRAELLSQESSSGDIPVFTATFANFLGELH